MSKKSVKKGIKSIEKQIGVHKEKQKKLGKMLNPELFHYYEKEILKFKREKKKKLARL